jgi:hypothetical protein
MTYNKDENGFTDEAIEAVEKKLVELAEKIQVSEEELGERIADATFRQSFDLIETELIEMNTVAIDTLLDRCLARIPALPRNDYLAKVWSAVAYVCGGIAGVFLALGVEADFRYNIMTALIFIGLMTMIMTLVVPTYHAINAWLIKEMRIDASLCTEINEDSRKILRSAREKLGVQVE